MRHHFKRSSFSLSNKKKQNEQTNDEIPEDKYVARSNDFRFFYSFSLVAATDAHNKRIAFHFIPYANDEHVCIVSSLIVFIIFFFFFWFPFFCTRSDIWFNTFQRCTTQMLVLCCIGAWVMVIQRNIEHYLSAQHEKDQTRYGTFVSSFAKHGSRNVVLCACWFVTVAIFWDDLWRKRSFSIVFFFVALLFTSYFLFGCGLSMLELELHISCDTQAAGTIINFISFSPFEKKNTKTETKTAWNGFSFCRYFSVQCVVVDTVHRHRRHIP